MADPICIQCGLPTGETHRLNRLPDGKVCSACRDRVLASLPPALPAAAGVRTTQPTRARAKRSRRTRRERA
ncbi:MAG: hypothetical protein IT453_14450 [Planctomycetes bacterium]|nr:hypothetical protein [Planctomycetota bacterium]